MTGRVQTERERIRALVPALAGRRVAVLADLVLDEYILCRTSRISREAPAALILRDEGRETRLGGGANAAANLRALGAEVGVVGVVGDDAAGAEILSAFARLKIDTGGIVVEPGYRTVVKTRILTSYHHSTRQQVLRIDREDTLAPAGPPDRIRQRLRELAATDALLISDYGYGAAAPAIATELTRAWRERGCPVTLDSRYRILDHGGATAATPNEPEVEAALGVSIGDDLVALERAGAEMLRRMPLQAIVITRGSRGMALFERGREMDVIPVFGSDEIADVTGAGDTVVAAYTLALAAGASHADSARLANVAGGIVVQKMGTATVTSAELLAALA